jgi:hypothetical protein
MPNLEVYSSVACGYAGELTTAEPLEPFQRPGTSKLRCKTQVGAEKAEEVKCRCFLFYKYPVATRRLANYDHRDGQCKGFYGQFSV